MAPKKPSASHKHIGTEHLLLGLLREEKCFAAEILQERGLRLPAIREELQRTQSGEGPRSAAAQGRSARCSRSSRAT
jgi:ATP-dependent Clp protease ATP-binding subunit ClpC